MMKRNLVFAASVIQHAKDGCAFPAVECAASRLIFRQPLNQLQLRLTDRQESPARVLEQPSSLAFRRCSGVYGSGQGCSDQMVVLVKSIGKTPVLPLFSPLTVASYSITFINFFLN